MQEAVNERRDASEVRDELARVVGSRVFRAAHRSQRLLTYLVEGALADPPVVTKEYTIAIEVFDRSPTYDPSVDATVRVEASRLRGRLREYYDEEGQGDPWVIEVPKGGYAVSLRHRPAPADQRTEQEASAAVEVSAAGSEPLAAAAVLPLPKPLRARWLVPWRAIALPAAAILLLSLTVGAVLTYARLQSRQRAPAGAGPRSLALLPIANQTGEPAMTYLADGLTDDLIRQLSQVPALRLMARNTVFHYRDRAAGQAGADPRTVARELGVEMVMTSELRRSPDHIVLTVEVTDGHDGSVMLDREYIADADDLRSVQAEVQRDVLRALHAEGSARDPMRPLHSVTSSPQAYREFLMADALARRGAPADLRQAIEHAQKAVALDPGFDLAWSALASEHLFLGLYFEPPREQMPVARLAAQRALQLNPNLGEAHGSLGLIDLVYDWNPAAAEAEMSTADAQAAAVSSLACTAHLVELSGHAHAAQELIGRMLTYDPQSAALVAEMGCIDFYRGQYDAALRYYREARTADPQSPVPYWGLGKTLNAENRHEEALAALAGFRQQNGFEPPLLTAEAGYALGASGHAERARALIAALQRQGERAWLDPYFVAVVYLSMSDRENAFLWLNKALDLRSPFAISILTEPKWQPMHSDPRFAQVVERLLHEHG